MPHLVACLLLALALPANAADKVTIDMWLRSPGGPASAAPSKRTTVDIAGLTLDEVEAYDLQYGKVIRVRGLTLRNLMAVFKPVPETVDTLLLHFHNKMIVPVSIGKLRQNLEMFVGVSYKDGSKWTDVFPPAPGEDGVAIKFAGNKLVVGKEWRQSSNDFTPWRHVDSLKGIEFVEGAAYFAQWQPASGPKHLSGHLVYGARCQFCHAISGVGAKLGPDFLQVMQGYGVIPTAKKPWKRLYEQVRDPRGFGQQAVHRMPDQGDFSEKEAKDLVEWTEAIAGKTPSTYEPTYAPPAK